MARMKPYDELEFVDDFVFCKVMRREEICKKVIELILGVKIKSIRTFDSQHAIELTANGKGVVWMLLWMMMKELSITLRCRHRQRMNMEREAATIRE